jgi:rare lipoprotein A
MVNFKKLCVCGVATMSLGVPLEAALAQCGTASWYHEGSRTATGERYQPDGITAAHRSLPFGTIVEVRNQRNGRAVTVRINDRGPYIGGRIIDLSRGAKQVIGMDGLAPVCIAVVGQGPRVASSDGGDRAATPRRSRMRLAALDREVKTSARVSRSRVASIASRKRVAAAERRSRLAARERRERLAEIRSRRAAERQARMRYEAANEDASSDARM